MHALRKKLSFKGFILGSIADIVGTNIWGFFLIIYLISQYPIQVTSSSQELTEQLSSIIAANPPIYILNLLIGSAFSILGGFVAAQIAKHDELLNGALSAFLCVITQVYSIVQGNSTFPLVVQILSLLLSPALGALGGYLKLRQRSRSLLSRSSIQSPMV